MESPLVSFRGEGWKILPGWDGYADYDPKGCKETARSSDRQRAERTVCGNSAAGEALAGA